MSGKPAFAALCAIARNEGPYLLEWIAYHKVIGFAEIIIYDNGSRDGSGAVLAALAECGEVAQIAWPDKSGVSPQTSAYLDAVGRSRSEWLAYLDVDEFLILHQDPDVSRFLNRFSPQVSAIALNWRVYGSSHRRRYGAGLVLERFTRCSPLDHHKNLHVKCLNRRTQIVETLPHSCILRDGLMVNENGEPITLAFHSTSAAASHRLAQVNHYVVKSWQECRLKIKRGRVLIPPSAPDKFRKSLGAFFAEHDLNDCEAPPGQAMLAAVKEEIQRLRSLLPPPLREPQPLPANWSPRLVGRW
jgi:hypothetical protein